MRETKTFRIERVYARRPGHFEVIARHLTEAEAKAHCRNPENSSRTATSDRAAAHTAAHGPWFDSFVKE